MEERILVPAIWFKDLKYETFIKVPEQLYPLNISSGIVFTGFRHLQIVRQVNYLFGKPLSQVGEYIEGFLTTKNRFVNREEGAKIAINSKQIEKLKYNKYKLFSEDLY